MPNPEKIDFHMHSTVSDGTDSPEELLALVRDAGITLFSLTDHDAVKGSLLIQKIRKEDDPRFLTGVELSCRDELGKYHILGYGYDPEAASVKDMIARGHGIRMKKVQDRILRLGEQFGIEIPEQEAGKLLLLDNPGKPHIANLMVRLGFVKTKEEAMKQYLNRMNLRSEYIRPEEAIRAILDGGGIPVLAHPSYGSGSEIITGEEMEERIRRLTEAGLQGVEAFYSGFTDKLIREILSFADRYGLFVTAGSDYHGKNKLIPLGDTNLSPGEEYPDGLKRFLKEAERRMEQKPGPLE